MLSLILFFAPVYTLQMNSAENNDLEPGVVVGEHDFENDHHNWHPREGVGNVFVTDEQASSGNSSLKMTERSDGLHMPGVDLTPYLEPGAFYEVEMYVKLAETEGSTNMNLTLLEQFGSSEEETDISGEYEVTDNDWVKLEGDFQYHPSATDAFLYVNAPENVTADFYVDEFKIYQITDQEGGPLPEQTLPLPIEEGIPSLKAFFADDFQIGAAIAPFQMTGKHGDMLEKHYNSLVAENIMKPEIIEPTEGNFYFEAADEMFDFAEEHDMDMRYHTLVWHSQVGDWFFLDEDGNEMVDETDPEKQQENKELLIERMKAHITEVVTRYKGQVDSWDVVNEVIDPNSDDPEGMRDSEWYQIAGKDFIAEAFKLVNELDPESNLYINDYNTHEPEKRDYLYDLIVKLLDEGVPIDGVGHQTHISNEHPPIEEIGESIEMFADLGLDNQITELDLSIYGGDEEAYENFEDIPDEIIEKQTDRYEELFDELLRLSEHISNVTFWGIADDHTWLHNRPVPRVDAPFLFDEKLQAKPAFWALVDDVEAEDIMDEIDRFEDNGEFDSDEVHQALQLHLIAVGHYENQEEDEKIVRHMEGFHDLLNNQLENDLISEKVYRHIGNQADAMIQAWLK